MLAHLRLVSKFKICGCFPDSSVQNLATRNLTRQLPHLLSSYVTYVEPSCGAGSY
jgi:hypothetical protein